MRWFKMHCEARTDAKLQVLTDKQFRYWFNLLCYAAERPTRGIINDCDISLLVIEVAGGDEEGLKETLSILEKLKIISVKENEITFINFNKRQYEKPSDQPNAVKERVKKHRAKKDSTNIDNVTPCNAKNRSDQNRSDQNRTDIEQNRVEQSITEEKKIPILIMSPEESQFHEILKSIPNYPYNEVTDHQMYLNLANDFPAVDLIEVAKDWKSYLLDRPLKPKSNPRSQLRNQCKLHLKWGKCLKQQETPRKKVYR